MKKVFLILCILGIIMPYYQLYFFLVGDNPTFDYFVSEIYSSHPVSMITWDITIAYISFFTFYNPVCDTSLVVIYASKPSGPPSDPYPESLTPPNGVSTNPNP